MSQAVEANKPSETVPVMDSQQALGAESGIESTTPNPTTVEVESWTDIARYHKLIQSQLEKPAADGFAKKVLAFDYQTRNGYLGTLTSDVLPHLKQCDIGSWDDDRIIGIVTGLSNIEIKKAIVAGMLACAQLASNNEERDDVLYIANKAALKCAESENCSQDYYNGISQLLNNRMEGKFIDPSELRKSLTSRPLQLQGFGFNVNLWFEVQRYEAETVRPETSRIEWDGINPRSGVGIEAFYLWPLVGRNWVLGASGMVEGGAGKFSSDDPPELWDDPTSRRDVVNYYILQTRAAAVLAHQLPYNMGLRLLVGAGLKLPLFRDVYGNGVDLKNSPYDLFGQLDLLFLERFHVGLRGTLPISLDKHNYLRENWGVGLLLGYDVWGLIFEE